MNLQRQLIVMCVLAITGPAGIASQCAGAQIARPRVGISVLGTSPLVTPRGPGFTGTGFEAGQGFVPGSVGGQQGWINNSGNQVVVAGGPPSSTSALKLSQGSSADPRPLGMAFSPMNGNATLSVFSIDTRVDDDGGAVYFVAGQSLSANSQAFRVEFDYQGHIHVLDPAVPSAVNGLVDTGVPWRQNLWTPLKVTLNTSTIRYEYNGAQIYIGQRFAPTAAIEQVVIGHDNFQEFGNGAFSTGMGVVAAGYFDNVLLAATGTAPNVNISQHPGNTSACVNGSAMFIVGATTSAGTLSYQWRKGTTPLMDSPGRFAGTATSTLTISNILSTDGGSYDCIVTGSTTGGSSSVTSNPATLTILTGTLQSVGVSPSGPVKYCPEGSAMLTVTPSPPGSYTYQWRKGTTSLVNSLPGQLGPTAQGVTTPTLSLANLNVTSAGAYNCVVTDVCGSATSASVTLTLCRADFDCSGQVAVGDIFGFLTAWFAGDPRAHYSPFNLSAQDIFAFLGAWFQALPIADFDGVNGINVQDIFAYLTAWFAGDPRADLDPSGLSVQDIFAFLTVWFAGC